MTDRGQPDDRLLHDGIATVLRAGTLIAVAAIGSGLAWALVSGEPGRTDHSVIELIADGGADALIGAGLLGLTLVPIFVVSLAAAGLWRSGERRVAGISIAVVALLLASLVAAAVIGSAPTAAAG